MLEPQTGFPCTMCGECCRHIDRIPQLAAFDDGTGACVYLRNNKCGIYPNRPEICNVDAMYEKYYKTLYPNKTDFYNLNREVCKSLQQSSGAAD